MPDMTDILLAGEQVCFVARGRVLTSRIPSFGRWSIIVTNRRLVLLRDESRPVRQQWHVALDQVESAYQQGLIRSKVIIITETGKFRILGLGRFAGAQLVSWLVGPRRRGAPDPAERPERPEHPVPVTEPAPTRAMLLAERLLARIEDLESDVDRLGKQVRFLEDLLESRQLEAPQPQLQLRAPAADEEPGHAGPL